MSKGDKVSLPDRMREAVKVLREADRRCHGRIEGWTPLDLEGTADAWEAEDRAKAEREATVEELAGTLWMAHELAVRGDGQAGPLTESHRHRFVAMARTAYEQGWRKGGSDE